MHCVSQKPKYYCFPDFRQSAAVLLALAVGLGTALRGALRRVLLLRLRAAGAAAVSPEQEATA